ncbi:hypothetical protein ACFPFP_17525 [Bradyrhizobium sp. GCM10023182]|uniref:Uncharacterized protein n=1 Tax=Bradyrhizobium zhengyangense TaxID=2911009 RepID=A0ABS9LP43_9BRAD|nr:hypothetical protein [Bradyrhizobium zhengyangense]MCG2668754.1 hypothetical protein [Bradyrhizobium zhengyangense]
MHHDFTHLTDYLQRPALDPSAALGGGALRAVHLHFQRIDPGALQRRRTASEGGAALERQNADLRRKVTNLEAQLADAEYRAATAEAERLRAVDGLAALEAEIALVGQDNKRQERWEPLRALWKQISDYISYEAVWAWCALSKRIMEAEQRERGVWYCKPSRFWQEFAIYSAENCIELPPHLKLRCERAGA